MLSSKPIDKIVFLSLKTVSQYPNYESMPVNLKFLFQKKHEKEINALAEETYYDETALQTSRKGITRALNEVYEDKAAVSPEFGKIAAIALGGIRENKFVSQTFSGDEQSILNTILDAKKVALFSTESITKLSVDICGHAIKSFHFPYLAKRMMLSGLDVPAILDTSALKPWEMTFLIDTMECWKMNQWDGNCSLDLLCELFGITRTEQSISGKTVNEVYWKEQDNEKIERFCGDDVFALAKLYLKLKNVKTELTR